MNEQGERLERLLDAGAAAFDGPTVRYVSTLLARAEAEGATGVAVRLLERVTARLDALEREMEAAREEARRIFADLAAIDEEGAREMETLVTSGDWREARRLGRSRLRGYDPEAPARLFARIARIEEEARLHDIRFSAELRSRTEALRGAQPLGTSALREGRVLAFELSTALIEQILSRSRGSLVITRIARLGHLPEQIGPYNPQAVATRVLSTVARLSPPYLRVWFDVLGELAALERLLPAPVVATRRRK